MNNINGKAKALLEHKQKILKEIQYCDNSIKAFCSNHKSNRHPDDSDSSDSEDFFPDAVESGPEVSELKLQQRMLTTCLQATQELTGLTVLQSEVNILVQEPQLKGESPILESGTWREVLSECKIDLVTFTITFFTHTADHKFAPTLYRGLQIQLVKACHEVELNDSVLHTLKRPSDAVEVIRSYAAAYRSRRTTLAHLANKYASTLFMEPHPEGGFVLKCANLLEILWRLENKWSPVAPFHHRMKFDVEYMDEAYIKIITQAHKQLLDPSIQTDERTLLLAKIIATCLQARGPVDSGSDLESIGVTSRKTETQPEGEPKDNEVMAPPKSLPKKSKNSASKDKDVSKDKNTAKKRSVAEEKDERNAKKVKTTEDGSVKRNTITKEKAENSNSTNKENNDVNKIDKPTNTVESSDVKKSKTKEKNELKKSSNKKNNKEPIVNNDVKKKSNEKVSTKRPTEKINNIDDDNTKVKNNQNVLKKQKNDIDIETANNTEQSKINDNKEINVDKVKSVVNNKKNDKQIKNNNKQPKNDDNLIAIECDKPKESEVNINTDIEKQSKNDIPIKKVDKKAKMAVTNDKKFDIVTKKKSINENKNNNPKINNKEETTKNDASDNVVKSTNKIIRTNTDLEHQNTKNTEKKCLVNKKTQLVTRKSTETTKNKTVKTITERNANILKNKEKVANINREPVNNVNDKQTESRNTEMASKNKKKLTNLTTKTVRNIIHKSPANKNLLKLKNSLRPGNIKTISGNIKTISGNTEKENGEIVSKIPQKKVSTDSENNFKRNMLRISPRKLSSKFKTQSQDSSKFMTKSTNIPRLMKKPVPKFSK